MIDISQFSEDDVKFLADMYDAALIYFNGNPLEAPKKEKRKFIKNIFKNYAEFYDKKDIFAMKLNDDEILLTLKESATLYKSIINERESKNNQVLSVFDESVRSAFELLSHGGQTVIKSINNDIEILIGCTTSFESVLTFKNVSELSNNKSVINCYYKNFEISKENDNRFRVTCNIESLINEINEKFSFIFETATVQVEVYNACNNFYCYYRPWDYLHNLCYNIKTKADYGSEYVNEKEKELMPLITEIRNFEYWGKCETIECFEFSELKKLVRKFEYIEIEEMLNKIEKVNCNDKNFYNTVEKLYSILNKKQYEPLFREIYNKIAQSQEQYPNKVETLCDKEMLENARSDIQTLMESKGYSGTYPDFYKIDSMKGIHLASSYNQTYFVGIEKNVKSHIHCTEEIDDEGLSIQFLCGTALLKKGEDETDIFGYSFNAKGRRLFDTMFYRISFEEYKAYNELKDLETYISIAVKKAECKKLNKEERTTIYGPLGGLGTFLTVFLVGGGLFAIFMTLAMMIICTLTTIAFGLFNDIPEMFEVIPWWYMFGFAWIGFGGLMGITEFLAKRK